MGRAAGVVTRDRGAASVSPMTRAPQLRSPRTVPAWCLLAGGFAVSAAGLTACAADGGTVVSVLLMLCGPAGMVAGGALLDG